MRLQTDLGGDASDGARIVDEHNGSIRTSTRDTTLA